MGVLFKLACRAHANEALTARGFSRRDIARGLRHLDDDLIETAMTMSGVKDTDLPPEPKPDRPIIDAIAGFFRTINEWFKTPEGQAFLKMLFQLLIGLIGGLSLELLVLMLEMIVEAYPVVTIAGVAPPSPEAMARAYLEG